MSIKHAPLKGSASARVVLIEYSEFQCPFCAQFWQNTLPTLQKDFIDTGQVLFAFRHFPLETIHPFALQAAAASTCAGRQGKFFEMHDQIFANPKKLDEDSLLASAKRIGVDTPAFHECLRGDAIAAVRAEAEKAQQLGVSGTPVFFIGTRMGSDEVKVLERIDGARPAEDFARAIKRVVESLGDR